MLLSDLILIIFTLFIIRALRYVQVFFSHLPPGGLLLLCTGVGGDFSIPLRYQGVYKELVTKEDAFLNPFWNWNSCFSQPILKLKFVLFSIYFATEIRAISVGVLGYFSKFCHGLIFVSRVTFWQNCHGDVSRVTLAPKSVTG